MIKVLLPLCVIFFIVLYMAFAFANWGIVWVAHVGLIARCLFILLFAVFFLLSSRVYFDNEDKF